MIKSVHICEVFRTSHRQQVQATILLEVARRIIGDLDSHDDSDPNCR